MSNDRADQRPAPPSELVRAAQARLLERVDAPLAGDADTDPLAWTVPDDLDDLEQDAGRYEVAEVMATGGFGLVRRAFDRRLGRHVAVKELRHGDPAAQRRFLLEATITARLQHPGIVPIHDIGRSPDGKLYYCMTLIDGPTLEQRLGEATSLRSRLALLPHVLAAADAVAHAHAQGVIHRDLKPANILVGEHGETVVIDWGLAKDLARPAPELHAENLRPMTEPDATLTDIGAILGTLRYMPPEQARGEAADRRSDVFALGAVLFHAIAGRPPRDGLQRSEILARLARGEREQPLPPSGEAPRELVALAEMAMAPRPGDRYPDAAAFADDLRRFLAGRLVDAHRYQLWELLAGWLRRHRAIVAVATIATLALLAASVIFLGRIRDERNQATAARQRAETSELQAIHRADLAVLAQARGALAEDLVAALMLLRQVDLDDEGNRRRARLTALAAEARGAPDRVLRGHHRRIEHIVGLSDGRLVSIDSRGEVRRWNVGTSRSELMADLQAPHGLVVAAAEAPVWAAIAGDRAYVVRGDEAGEDLSIAPLYQGSYKTHRFVLSRHGETLAALETRGSGDAQNHGARTWDLLARPAYPRALPYERSRRTALSPDGATLATLDAGRPVLIRGDTITPVPELRGLGQFSASGRYLLGIPAEGKAIHVALDLAARSLHTVGEGAVITTTVDDFALLRETDGSAPEMLRREALVLRSLATGASRWTADLELTKEFTQRVYGNDGGFTVAHRGDAFAVHLGDLWQLRSMHTGEPLRTLAAGPHLRGEFLADGGFVVAHDTDLWLWSAPSPATTPYHAAAAAPDGSHLIAHPWPASEVLRMRAADRQTTPLACLAGVLPQSLAGAQARLAIDGRGRVLFADADICLEEIGGPPRSIAVPARATSVALAQHGDGFVVGLVDGTVLGFADADATPLRWQLDGPPAQLWAVGALAGVVARTDAGAVVALHPGRPVPTPLGLASSDRERRDVRVVMHPTRPTLAAVLLGLEDAVVFLDAERGASSRRPVAFASEPAAAYSPGGRQFAIGLADRRLLVLTDDEGEGRELALPEDLRALAFIDEQELAAVSTTGALIRIDLAVEDAVVVHRAWKHTWTGSTQISAVPDGPLVVATSDGALWLPPIDPVPRDPATLAAWLSARTQ